jgi:uncharacterized membrane protein YGL010W
MMDQPSRLDRLLTHYASSHQHPINEAIHCVAVPVIMLTLLGLIFEIHPILFAVFLGASLVYYARLSIRVVLLMAVWSFALAGLILLMREHRLAICVTFFVIAWIGQFVGHRIEGKKPSFFEDLQYLWVGPLFVADVLLRRMGRRLSA